VTGRRSNQLNYAPKILTLYQTREHFYEGEFFVSKFFLENSKKHSLR